MQYRLKQLTLGRVGRFPGVEELTKIKRTGRIAGDVYRSIGEFDVVEPQGIV